jgi:hypothetical protein
MFEHLDQSDLTELLKVLEAGLVRHFSDDWLVVDGDATHVDEILDEVQGYLAQLERTHTAFATWHEESTFLRDELRCEIAPLLGALRRFVANEFGPDSPLLREFGFEPLPRPSREDIDEGLDEDLDNDLDEDDDEDDANVSW